MREKGRSEANPGPCTYISLNLDLVVHTLVHLCLAPRLGGCSSQCPAALDLTVYVICDGVNHGVALLLQVSVERADLGGRLLRLWEIRGEFLERDDVRKTRRE